MKSKDIGSLPGTVIRGNVVGFNPRTKTATVQLNADGKMVPVKILTGWASHRGEMSGGCPSVGTPIFVVQGHGNEWVAVNYDTPDNVNRYDGDGSSRVDASSLLKPGRWVTLVQNDVRLAVDPNSGIIQGDPVHYTQADPKQKIWSSRFVHQTQFTDGHRSLIGPIKRDITPNNTRDAAGSSLDGHRYLSGLKEIGLDPKPNTSISDASIRNPTLNEARSMFYEFAQSFDYTNDETEEKIYSGEDLEGPKKFQRKRSITDTMSLSLDHPNFLAEIIIGTAVDIYGNILDINRSILPSGLIESLSFRNDKEDKDLVFRKLREQLRKSIAYHFEINARKENIDESTKSNRDFPGIYTPDYFDRSDYARSRSRFSVDIDKEGQFKMNVPASSEVGNVPLLVRSENYSNIRGAEQNTDRGEFKRDGSEDTDIKLEPHGVGVISLTSNEETLKSFSAPLNRFDGEKIKLGTGFHDISGVLRAHKFPEPYTDFGTGGYNESVLNSVPPVEDVVSTEIIVAGEGANAGGRSGTISMDGMLSLSLGANTADRQSLWLDCAGGIVGAIGRDRFDRSIAATLDGDVFLEVGSVGIFDDSRFPAEVTNVPRDGVVDIRVWNAGSFHTIRIDRQGINIHTPQRIDIVSESTMRLKSVNSNLYLDAESIYFYNDDSGSSRYVLKATEGGAGRTI